MSVAIGQNFIPQLVKLSENPEQELKDFEDITPTYEKRADKAGVITGIVCCIISAVIAKDDTTPAVPLFALGAFLIYKSQSAYTVESSDSKQKIEAQKKRINDIFNPCIDGLKKATQDKIEAIKTVVNDHPAQSMEDVKKLVVLVADIYDYKSNPDQWKGNAIPQNPMSENDYSLMLKSAAILMNKSEKDVSKNSVVQERFLSLKTTSKQFIEGIKPSSSSVNYYYVQYGWNPTSHKAKV